MQAPKFKHKRYRIYHGDSVEIMNQAPAQSVATVITDPPYFVLDATWDTKRGSAIVDFHKKWTSAAFRITKPGGLLFSFSAPRTYHHLAVAAEMSGWIIRDCIMWVTTQGRPNAHDISKGVDKEVGAVRTKVKQRYTGDHFLSAGGTRPYHKKAMEDGYLSLDSKDPASDEGLMWDGYVSRLRPAWEPILVAMKPLEGTYAQNALKHGVAGFNKNPFDKWPQNTVLSCCGKFPHDVTCPVRVLENQRMGSSRMFLILKPDRKERDKGLEEGWRNTHATVKPVALMKHLALLSKPPKGGLIVDPFVGSGSTILGGLEAGRKVYGIEVDETTCLLANQRAQLLDAKRTIKTKAAGRPKGYLRSTK